MPKNISEFRCQIEENDLVIIIPESSEHKAKELADFFFAALSPHHGAGHAFARVSITVEDVEVRSR